MDLTHDGISDIISGSYPGEIFLFAGMKDGSFQKGVKLQGQDGKDLKMERASAVCVTDWDRDGDLDLVVGNIKGEVWFVENEGSQGANSFRAPVKITLGGEPITAPGRNAGPQVADWDGDGIADLVVGCGDGSVRVYPNTAAEGVPVLAKPIEVLPKCATYGRARQPGAKQPAGPERGSRAKVWVADWNGDGRNDLLVGDYLSRTGPEPQLSAEQKAERDRLQKAQTAMRASYQKIHSRIQKQLEKEYGYSLRNAPAEKRAEVQTAWRKLIQADAGYQDYTKSSREIRTKLRDYLPKRTSHGHVWVYLRKGPRTL